MNSLFCAGSTPEDLARRQAAMNIITPLFEGAGHAFIDPPVLAPADLFLSRAGEAMRQRLYLTQGAGGESLCLRPDMTLPAAQMALSGALGDALTPAPGRQVKLAYGGLTFRIPEGTGGAEQGLETGVEIFGGDDAAGEDAAVLALAVQAVEGVGGTAPRVTMGDLGLMRAFLAALPMPPRWRDRLVALIGKPEAFRALLKQLSEEGRATSATTAGHGLLAALAGLTDLAERRAAVADVLAMANVEAVGGRSVEDVADRLLEQAEDIAEEPLAGDVVDLIEKYLALDCAASDAPGAIGEMVSGLDVSALTARLEAMADAGLDVSAMRFGGGFGRRFDYYTGFVFEIETDGAARPVAAGGRYDTLLQELGAAGPVPAIGMTIRPDRFTK